MLSRLLVPVALSSALLFFGPSASSSSSTLLFSDVAISSPPEIAAPTATGTSTTLVNAKGAEIQLGAEVEQELAAHRLAVLDEALSRTLTP